MRFPKKQAETKVGGFIMKKHRVLSLLIGIVLIAMFLPWAYLWKEAVGPDAPDTYRAAFGNYALGALVGDVYVGFSFVLALAAFVLSFFNGKKPACRIICGLLLLGSAGLCLCEGIWGGFDCFTALTWAIFGALIALGLWALFFLRGKTKVEVE